MLEIIMELSSSIINSVVVNAVPDLSVAVALVVLLSVLSVLLLTNSVNSILLYVKNSISTKAIARVTDKVKAFRYIEANSGSWDHLPV